MISMRRGLRIIGVLLGLSLIFLSADALTTAQSQGSEALEPQCDISHEGDLVIEGNKVFSIESITYCQFGPIHVRNNAKLIVRNGTLIVNRSSHIEDARIFFNDDSQFEIDHSSVSSNYDTYFLLADHTNGQISHSHMYIRVEMGGESSLNIADSYFELGVGVGESATLTVTNSTMGLGFSVGYSASASCSQLRPGYYSDWNLHRDCSVKDLPLDVTLVETTIRDWRVAAVDSAVVTLDNCSLLGLGLRGEVNVTVRNSTVYHQVDVSFRPGQVLEIRDLRSGYIENGSIKDDLTLTVQNSQVEGWGIEPNGANVTIEDSELRMLHLGSLNPTVATEVNVINSFIHRLNLGLYDGTLSFINSTVKSVWGFPRWSTATIKGSVEFINEEPILVEEEPWYAATVTREFPVIVQDSSGSPLPNVDLELYSPLDELIWSGKSDSEGKATFELIFNDDNHQDEWTLKATLPDGEIIARRIGFLTDTPVEIVSAREASEVSDVRCDITHEGDLIISGDEVFTIQNITYCQKGSINLHDRAKLLMNNARLIFISSSDCCLNLYNNTTAQLNQSLLSNVHVHIHDNAILEINNSTFEEGGIRLFGSEIGVVTLNATGSLLSKLELWPAPSAVGSCSSIRPGHLENWNFRRDCKVSNPSIEVQLSNTTIGPIEGTGWAFVLTGSANFSFDDAHLNIIHIFDRAAAIITNSTLESARLSFHAGQMVTLKGLRWGYIPYWSLRDLNPSIEQSFVVQNSEVIHAGWDIYAAGSDVIVSDSELDRFMPSDGTFARLSRSIIHELWLGTGEGTVIFEDMEVISMINSVNSIFRLEGTVKFRTKEVAQWGNWQNSTITREFPVLAQDSAGFPLPDVDLELYSPQDELIWSGKSDSEGKATFEIRFDDDNYQKIWTLKAPDLGVERDVRLLTDTPIVITAP